MSAINPPELLIIPALILCSAATWRAIVYRKKADQQKQLLIEADETLREMHNELVLLQEKDKKASNFNKTLNQAEITTRLQKSRLTVQDYSRSMSPPERYRYVHSLAANGMPSDEIASVLSISIHETEQLVNLSRLAHATKTASPSTCRPSGKTSSRPD